MKAFVSHIQRFCMHDGPGIRTTVFLKGCPLHCRWCHNPETQANKTQLLYTDKLCTGCTACMQACSQSVHRFEDGIHVLERNRCISCGKCVSACPANALELSGTHMSPDEIVAVALRDKAFYGKEGGITVSGGEPLEQANVVGEIFQLAKAAGLTTLLDTSGYGDFNALKTLVPVVDYFYWDIKDTDKKRHLEYTGVSPDLIFENLKKLDRLLQNGQTIRIRCILVEGINTDEDHYAAVTALFRELTHCEGVELIPYHAMGGSKMVRLGLKDNGNKSWIPSEETIIKAEKWFESAGIPLCHGRR